MISPPRRQTAPHNVTVTPVRPTGIANETLAVVAPLTRSERRSWILHRALAKHLSPATLTQWRPTIDRNLQRLHASVTGEPHTHNLRRWESLVTGADIRGLHHALTGLDRDSIEMREVSPMGGILSEGERVHILQSRN